MMKTIFIDSEYCCHITNTDGVFRELETNFFDGKCDTFIEGYRFVPADETWVRSDGKVFHGEMITPWKDYSKLMTVQRQYEQAQLAECKEALRELGVEVK